MRAEVDVRPVRERRRARSRWAFLRAINWRKVAVRGGGGLLALTLAAGVFFAGSSSRIAAGVTVAGVNVAGMTPSEAAAVLKEEEAKYRGTPVVLAAGDERFRLRPVDLDARVDWGAVTAEARAKGSWPLPFRGVKRVALRLFGAEVTPVAAVYEPRLQHELDRIARRVDQPGRDAAIALDGLEPRIVPDREGRTLDREETRRLVLEALGGFEREPLDLPLRIGPPAVRAEDLEPAVEQVRTALSGSVRFGWRDAHWQVQPKELASLLRLPADGRRDLQIGGRGADRYFGVLARAVDQKPQNASFVVASDGGVRIVPGASGRVLDVPATAKALLAAALTTDRREAELVVRSVEPRLTTEKARSLGITSVLATYSTAYSGSEDRIRNLQLATELIDGTTLAPGATFSFNEVVGPRTAKRGFRMAPTIVDGEYEDQLGGGVSQVATTVFNAAWEAGLKITARTAHSLYISRYPLGRDATVNYPDVDLRFVNDTDHWIAVRAQSTGDGIAISLLGAPTNRRVESVAGELREVAPPEEERIPDPTLLVGDEVVEEAGQPSRTVSVKRVVYEGEEVLYDETWYTTYISEPKVVRVGTIPVPDEPPPPPPPPSTPPASPPSSPPAPPPPPTTTTPTTTAPRAGRR
jgi:vancomycin resistance protein YoaR